MKVAPMHISAVHQHAVQLVQIPDGLIRLLCQEPAVSIVQVQLLWEAVPVIDLQWGPSCAVKPFRF